MIKLVKYKKNNELTFLLKENSTIDKVIINQSQLINTKNLEKNIIGIEFIQKNDTKSSLGNLELQIIKEIEGDNDVFIIDFSDKNNPQILNKELIIENIDKNLFKYFKDRNEFASRIHLAIFNYKKLISSDYFGRLLFTETPLSFLFLDIYDKQINDENEFEVEYIIQSIPIDEKIPVKLIFKLDEEEKDNIKLNFRMDYYDNKMSRNVLVSKVRDLLKKEIFEKMDFDLDLSGYYILDKENFKIKEIKANQRIKIDEKLYEREFFIKEETEIVEEIESSDLFNEEKIKVIEENIFESQEEIEELQDENSDNNEWWFNLLNKINSEKEFSISELKKSIKSLSSEEKKEISKKIEAFMTENMNLNEIFRIKNSESEYIGKEMLEIFKQLLKPIEETFDGIRDWLLPLLRKDDKIIFPKEEFLERVKLFDEAEKLRTFNVIKSAVEHNGYCVKFEEGKTIEGYEVKKIFGEMLGIAVEEEVVEKMEEKEVEIEEEKKLTPQQLRKKYFLKRMKGEDK